MNRSEIKAEVNHEETDPQLDNLLALSWYKADKCPIEGCRHFKKAKAWSMVSEENVVAYLKHHLMRCTGEGHTLSRREADDVVEGVLIDVAFWEYDDRKQWAEEQDAWRREQNRTKRGHSPPAGGRRDTRARPSSASATADMTETVVRAIHIAQQTTAKSVPMISMGDSRGNDVGFGSNVPVLTLSNPLGHEPSAALVVDSLVRAEVAIKAAMHQCITNARNLQHELIVIQEALKTIRPTLAVGACILCCVHNGNLHECRT